MESRHLKQKPTDKRLTENVLKKLPEAQRFNELKDLETRIDILINRKRLDLQDMIGRSMRKRKTLRIFVSSSVENQPWQRGNTPGLPGEEGSWKLRIEGRLVDPDEDSLGRAFSSMLTSIIVELRQDKPDGEVADEVVEWHETPPDETAAPNGDPTTVEFDGMDIRRQGESSVRAKIFLQLKEYPDKFKLAPALQDVLGVTEESNLGAVVSLWQYVRFHKLQDVDERRLIRCDEPLRKLFKRDTIAFPQLVELLTPYLSLRDPVVIDFNIPVDGANEVAFDVPIYVDHPLRKTLLSMLNSWHSDLSQLRQLNDRVIQDVQLLNLQAHQEEFYARLADDPLEFLKLWTELQARDLKIIYSDRQLSEETVRQSQFFDEEVMNQSLHLFLSNRR